MNDRETKQTHTQRANLAAEPDRSAQHQPRHNPRAQLRQNAAFMAQMKAVQRKEMNDSGKRWNMQGQDREYFRAGTVNDPQFTCSILRLVWPNRRIDDALCQNPEVQELAGHCLRDLIFGSKFMDVIPRPAVPTPGWVMEQIKDVIVRQIADRGVYNTILTAIASTRGKMLDSLIHSRHYTTPNRGLGF